MIRKFSARANMLAASGAPQPPQHQSSPPHRPQHVVLASNSPSPSPSSPPPTTTTTAAASSSSPSSVASTSTSTSSFAHLSPSSLTAAHNNNIKDVPESPPPSATAEVEINYDAHGTAVSATVVVSSSPDRGRRRNDDGGGGRSPNKNKRKQSKEQLLRGHRENPCGVASETELVISPHYEEPLPLIFAAHGHNNINGNPHQHQNNHRPDILVMSPPTTTMPSRNPMTTIDENEQLRNFNNRHRRSNETMRIGTAGDGNGVDIDDDDVRNNRRRNNDGDDDDGEYDEDKITSASSSDDSRHHQQHVVAGSGERRPVGSSDNNNKNDDDLTAADTSSPLYSPTGRRCEDEDPSRDDVFSRVGTFGSWQRNICILCTLLGLPFAWHLTAASFFAPGVDHWCSKPREFPFFNWTDQQWKNYAVPRDGQGHYERCEMYDHGVLPDPFIVDPNDFNFSSYFQHEDRNAVRRIECGSWTFNRSIFGHTIQEQWNLVCGNSYLGTLTEVTFLLGLMTGSLLYGNHCDRSGRKKVVLFGSVQALVFGLLTCLCQDLLLFLVLRFLVAMGLCGLYVSAFAWMIELIGAKERAIVGSIFAIPFSLGTISMVGISYRLLDWRLLQLVITAPMLLILAIFWFVPDSPRWLFATKRYQKGNLALERIARDGNSFLNPTAVMLGGHSNNRPSLTSSIAAITCGNNVSSHPRHHAPPAPTTTTTALIHHHHHLHSPSSPPPSIEDAKKLENEIMSAYVNRQLRNSTNNNNNNGTLGGGGTYNDYDTLATMPASLATLLQSRRGTTASSVLTAPPQQGVCPKCAHSDALARFEVGGGGIVGGAQPSATDMLGRGGADDVPAAATNFFDVFRTANSRRRTLVLLFAWFANGFAFFGLAFGLGNFVRGDLLFTVLAGGLVEIPACLLTTVAVLHVGRRLPLCAAATAAGLASIIVAFVPNGNSPQDWAGTSLKLLARFFMASSSSTIRLLTAELYPTTARGTGLGMTSASAFLGGACSLSINYFLTGQDTVPSTMVQHMAYGVMAVASGLCVFALPETKEKRLTETLSDAEFFGQKWSDPSDLRGQEKKLDLSAEISTC